MIQAKLSLRLFVTATIAVSAFATASLVQPALAQFPEKPIELVIKAGPGSGMSQLAHTAAKLGPKIFGQPMAALYKKGGSGAVAQAYVQKRAADGYNIFMDTTTTAIVLSRGKVPFTEDDWVGVIRMQVDPQGIAVRADSPWKSFGDLVAHIKKNPGTVRWTGAHSVGMDPYTVDLLLASAGLKQTDIKYVPERGASNMRGLLLGKHVEVATLNPGEAREEVEAGNIRVLGIAHKERIQAHPDWPTFKEQGFDVEAAIWRGVLVKKGTPASVIKTIHDKFNELRSDAEFQKFMKAKGALDGYMGGTKNFDAYFKKQVKDLRKHFASN